MRAGSGGVPRGKVLHLVMVHPEEVGQVPAQVVHPLRVTTKVAGLRSICVKEQGEAARTRMEWAQRVRGLRGTGLHERGSAVLLSEVQENQIVR